jgi:hypothetical protein
MASSQSNAPMTMTQISTDERFLERSDRQRRRKCGQGYFTTLTAFTIAATYLVSSAAGFTSTTPVGTRPALEKGLPARSSRFHPSGVAPFGTTGAKSSAPFGSLTHLFLGADSNSDKEEWRALLAAFQMYKAAYGDLKVPLRFVVPSMEPWPGEYYLFAIRYCFFQ